MGNFIEFLKSHVIYDNLIAKRQSSKSPIKNSSILSSIHTTPIRSARESESIKLDQSPKPPWNSCF